jgi:protein disulfide-isomerase
LLKDGKLALGGPFMDGPSGGMMIPEAGVSAAEMRALTAEGPSVKSGLLVFEIRPWMPALHKWAPRVGSAATMPHVPTGLDAMKRLLPLITLAFAFALAQAGALPYDEKADAKAELKQALAAAQASHEPVLVVFGANWCEDCRALDKALHTGRNAELIAKEFKVVKVDVGNFDRNLDVATTYGNPIKKGIPAAVVLSPDNQVLYATRAGELADARRMSESGIYDFFRQAADAAKAKP